MPGRIVDLFGSADTVVRELLAVRPGEQVGLVADPHSVPELVDAVAAAVQSVGAEHTVLCMPTREDGRRNELTPPITAALRSAQVLIGLTGASGAPTYAGVVKELLAAEQIRMISMVMRPFDVFTGGGANADYSAVHADGERLARRWSQGRTMGITSAAGTDITAPIARDDVIIECGYADKPGMAAAFPDGEVSSRPIEGTASGTIVVDGPIAHIGRPEAPLALRVEHGRVIEVTGACPQAGELQRIIRNVPNAEVIAEFGIGLNPRCRRSGQFEEEKKALGNVHIAIGDNVFYGGGNVSPVHMDMVLCTPTVLVDGEPLLERGGLPWAPVAA